MKRTLYIDIETIPAPEAYLETITVKPPANIKKQESIDTWHKDKGPDAKQAAYLKTSFNGGYGQVCAFSFAVDDAEAGGFTLGSSRDSEVLILTHAINSIDRALDGHNNPYVCGHFVAGFDLRFLMHRCVVLGIKMPHWLQTTCNAAAWSDKIIDTMTLWAGAKGKIGLDELCTILGIPGKGDFDGSQVYEAWKNGEHEKIGAYCNDDVERVRAVHRKFLEAGL